MCFAPQRRALFPHLNFQKWSGAGVFCTFWLQNVVLRHNGVHFFDISTAKSGPTMVCFVHFYFEMCFAPQRRLFRHLNFQKWSGLGVFCILTSKCASRHNGVHISTSKSGANMWCFVYFDLEMCFAPQRRALFRHLNFQKCSENGVFCTFWLANALRATLIWPAGSAPAALASLLFDPPEPQIIGKTRWTATFLPFRASASSFFWLFLFSDLLSSNLSLLSASALLCFSSVHIVGSLTSKLPSTTLYHKAFPSTTLYYKACTKHFPVYFVLQSLHKALPRTTLYYKACTKTLYYKACTEHVPVLLCTTKLARSTSQYYFVLQSLHKALPSTTLYYKLTWQPAGHLRKGDVFLQLPR